MLTQACDGVSRYRPDLIFLKDPPPPGWKKLRLLWEGDLSSVCARIRLSRLEKTRYLSAVLMNAALVVTLCNHTCAHVSKAKTSISFPCRDYFYGKQGADREIDHMTQHVELSAVEAANW